MKKLKVVIFHPWIKSKGGAEKVVLSLSSLKNIETNIYTWFYDQENTFSEFKNRKIFSLAPKWMGKFARKKISRAIFLFFSLFKKVDLKQYDLLIISTSGIGEFFLLKNNLQNKTYAYIHTPLREFSKDIHFNSQQKRNLLQKLNYTFLKKIYDYFEKKSWEKINYLWFNSHLSKKRAEEKDLIKFAKKIKVIYPPVDIINKKNSKKRDYFLYISRFNPPKRQKEVILAFKEFLKENPKEKLILAGFAEDKRYFEELKRLAQDTPIKIIDNLKNEEIEELYSNSKAVIFTGFKEDFGIVPFEAMSYGKPLIISEGGGYEELIKKYYKNSTIWIKENSDITKEILNSLNKFISSKIKRKKIRIDELSNENFRKKILEELSR